MRYEKGSVRSVVVVVEDNNVLSLTWIMRGWQQSGERDREERDGLCADRSIVICLCRMNAICKRTIRETNCQDRVSALVEDVLREVGTDQVQKVVSRTRSSSEVDEAGDEVVELLTKAIILP